MTAALHWVREHDDRLTFVVLYVGGAIILRVWLNLFWVAMLMLGNFGLCRRRRATSARAEPVPISRTGRVRAATTPAQ